MTSRWQDYVILTKFRLVMLAVFATLVGFVMGSPSSVDLARGCWTLIGAAFVGFGGNALNQWMEQDADAQMARTRLRPLPAGRMSSREAVAVGLAATGLGLGCLLWRVNGLAAGLALITVVSYVGFYTPLKRISPLCTLVGAVPGALPPLIGWAGARGSLSTEAWVLFGILFLWQLPHFLALAWVHREEYARAGFRMLPLTDPEGTATARQMVIYGLALLPTSLLPTVIGATGLWYFVGAMIIGVWFVGVTLTAARVRTVAVAQQLFYASLGYLPFLMGLMLLDKMVL